jgi:quercetin dioxygenase-like cupin family protein
MQTITVENDAVAPKFYEWGAVKWVIDDAAAPGTRQSFGVVYIHPGKTNPTHWHTTAQEVVHMLQGECDIRTDDGTVTLRAGQTLFIPVGAPHELTNRGWEPAVYVCSFSASGRGTLFADPDGPGVEPIQR